MYFGSCSTTFKARFNNHISSFRHRSKAASTELSKHVWKLKNSNRPYNITWNVIKHATPFRSGAKACGLCLAEKLQIMQAKPGPLLNKRSELVSKCRHKAKFLRKTLCKCNFSLPLLTFRCSFNFNLNTAIPNVNVIYFGLYYIWKFAYHSRL